MRAQGCQVEKIQDFCKDDWADSLIFKRAMREETLRRGFEPTDNFTDEDSHVTDTDGYRPLKALSPRAPLSPKVEANTQDPDSDVHQIKEAYADTALAFLS